jgi:hypothetical protein
MSYAAESAGLVRLAARRDIVGPEWTFYKGQRLVGKRDGPGRWAVWPRRDPLAFLVGVPDELVRELRKPPSVK